MASPSPFAMGCTRKPVSFAYGAIRATRPCMAAASCFSASGIGDAEPDAADLGLVGEVGREDLQCHREGDVLRRDPAACAARRSGLTRPSAANSRRASASSGATGRAWAMAGARHGARRAPFRPGADAVGGDFRGAEGGDAGLGQQAQRCVGLRHQEGGDRLGAAGVAAPGAMPATASCGLNWAEEPMTESTRSVSSAACSASMAAATRSGLAPARVRSSRRPWWWMPAASSFAARRRHPVRAPRCRRRRGNRPPWRRRRPSWW